VLVLGAGVKSVNIGVVIGNKLDNQIFEPIQANALGSQNSPATIFEDSRNFPPLIFILLGL